MKKTSHQWLAGSCLLSMALITPQATLAQANVFPTDPQTTNCSVDQATLNSWFGGTPPVLNAQANAADSTGFPSNNTRCDFYKWSSQMFLWLASPSGQSYVFDTVGFFDVSATDSSGKRKLISNTADNVGSTFSVRSTKADDTDSVNAKITGETGQAGSSGTLISQDGSIVYYGVHVNDVYAYFLSGQKNLNLPKTDFPTTSLEMDAVALYAASQGVQLPDLHAGPMELKTSWVDVASVSDASKYLKITAEVPKYTVDPKNQVALLQSGTETKTLVLVGMHIVGSVKGHPELVWATVEHIDNAPDTSYSYINNNGDTSTADMPTTGSWTFAPSTLPTKSSDFNVETVSTINNNLIAAQGDTLSSGTVSVRDNPWGSAALSETSNIQDPENNAELISLNNDIMSMLPTGDPRQYYFVSGAVWTQHGNIPTYDGAGPSFTQKGSLSLSNSTMETFTQVAATDATKADGGCFLCHSISGAQATAKQGVAVSHIYGSINAIAPVVPLEPGPVTGR